MKPNQDLYYSGSLRRPRLGPSCEWEYANSDIALVRSALGVLFRRVRGLIVSRPRYRHGGAAPRLECLRRQRVSCSQSRPAAGYTHPWQLR